MQGYLSTGSGGSQPGNALSYGFAGASEVCGGVSSRYQWKRAAKRLMNHCHRSRCRTA